MAQMKFSLLIIFSLFLFACKSEPLTAEKTMQAIIEAHGGVEKWKSMAAMSFKKGEEMHQIDLWSRRTRVETDKYSYGFDGNHVWLKQDSLHFTKSARFYHNLYFYFHAIPFVLADPGINYQFDEEISLDGKTYQSIKVSFNENVGDSDQDLYIIFYDPESFRMHWLAYTVTYFSKEVSDRFSLIHYFDWQDINGLSVAKKLKSFQFKDRKKGNDRWTIEFKETLLNQEAFADAVFAKPEKAKIVEK